MCAARPFPRPAAQTILPGRLKVARQTMRITTIPAILALTGAAWAAPAAVIVDEKTVLREEPPPHGEIGMSTAYRISDAVPNRTMEFRKRILHVGAAIGVHPIAHDEVYYVLSGEGELTSAGAVTKLTPGLTAYLFNGDQVGIKQVGAQPLALIISYPLPTAAQPVAKRP
jgi:mannose-6-phosphate isomerase-like protein (cupin superfamily)